MTRLFRRTIVAAALLALLASATVALAQTANTFFITEVDTAAFPVVLFSLRAVDLSNQPVAGLSASNMTVFENGQPIADLEVTPHTDGPITYILMLDLGRLSNFETSQGNYIRQVISTLAGGGYFIDDRDTVMVLARQNVNSDQTVTLLPATQTATDLTTWVSSFGFDRGRGSTRGLLGVEDAIRQATELVPIPGSETVAVIYITRYIEDPSPTVAPTSAQNTAAEARKNYISVHVFQTDPNQGRKEALQVLADGSNGIHAALNRSNFLSAATAVYDAINAQRTYYTVSYRSTVAESGRREITINSPDRPSEGVIGEYELTLQSPSVTIVEPVPNSTILREAIVGTEGTPAAFEATRVRVSAEVSWPDGYPRNLRSAQLFANDNLEDSIEVEAGQAELAFEWDLSDIISEGLNSVILEVRIEDELGLIGEGDSVVSIEVVIPPTPTAEGPAIPTSVAALSVPVLCLLGIAGAGIIGGAFYFFRLRSGPTEAAPAAQPGGFMATVYASDLDLAPALATLTVLEGPKGLIDEVLKITSLTTKLGRNPAQTDIAFYSDEESSVSRVHCSIALDGDDFKLTDMNSSAGTRLNGRNIQPNTPVVLADGDEIVLGDLARRGVKLLFKIGSGDSGGPSGPADDRTHLIGDLEPGEWEGFAED